MVCRPSFFYATTYNNSYVSTTSDAILGESGISDWGYVDIDPNSSTSFGGPDPLGQFLVDMNDPLGGVGLGLGATEYQLGRHIAWIGEPNAMARAIYPKAVGNGVNFKYGKYICSPSARHQYWAGLYLVWVPGSTSISQSPPLTERLWKPYLNWLRPIAGGASG